MHTTRLIGALFALLCVTGLSVALSTPVQSQQTAPTNPEATIVFEDQTSNGTAVRVNSVNLSQSGFVAIHETSLTENNSTVGSVIGVSERLSAGPHQDVVVDLYSVEGREFNQSALQENGTLVAMAHFDSNDNQEFDFVQTNGSVDGPYFEGPQAITQRAEVSIESEETTTEGLFSGVNPFVLVGTVLVIVALLVLTVVVVRRQ